MDGLLKIDKEEDFTSFDVDKIIKRVFDTRKVGHAGTLDPFATGLLIVAVNQGTKCLSLLEGTEKEYLATLKLGEETDTLDKTGAVTRKEEVPDLSEDTIKEVLSSFIGESLEMPPKYSAKRINGVRAYALSRRGIEPTMTPIKINIKKMEFISYDKEEKEITFRALVSKGTYIRSLGRDIAVKLGTVGSLSKLRRLKEGNYDLSDAKNIKVIKTSDLIPMEDFFFDISSIECPKEKLNMVENGGVMFLDRKEDFIFVKKDGRLIAIYRKDNDRYRSYRGFDNEH